MLDINKRGEDEMDDRKFNNGPREMHKAICSDCGQEAMVPFKPVEGRSVYCRNCYGAHAPKRY